MTKPEWGTKRMCPSCGTRFYDMKRSPVDCPSCEAIVPTETIVRSRKSAPAAPKVVVPPVVEKKTEDDAEGELIADANVELDEDDDNDDDESLIEDTSDLAADEEVSEIAEHMESDGNSEN